MNVLVASRVNRELVKYFSKNNIIYVYIYYIMEPSTIIAIIILVLLACIGLCITGAFGFALYQQQQQAPTVMPEQVVVPAPAVIPERIQSIPEMQAVQAAPEHILPEHILPQHKIQVRPEHITPKHVAISVPKPTPLPQMPSTAPVPFNQPPAVRQTPVPPAFPTTSHVGAPSRASATRTPARRV